MRRSALISLVLALLFAGSAGATELDQFGRSRAWKGSADRYTVVDFAASWCGPCWKTLPKLQALADLHTDLRVLVVSVDDEVSGRDRLVEELGLRLPVLWDSSYAIARYYEPAAMPATYVLDLAGNVIYHHSGSSKKDWTKLLGFVEGLSLAGARDDQAMGVTP